MSTSRELLDLPISPANFSLAILHLSTSYANCWRITSPSNFSCQLLENNFSCQLLTPAFRVSLRLAKAQTKLSGVCYLSIPKAQANFFFFTFSCRVIIIILLLAGVGLTGAYETSLRSCVLPCELVLRSCVSLGPGRGPIAPSRPDCTVGPRLRHCSPMRPLSTVPSWRRLVLLDTVVRPHPKENRR